MSIEINNEFKQALNILFKTNDNVFVTGKAGTGKTTFLKYYVSKCNKKFVILAPTGVAALNAGGETIHSFFKFKTDITLDKIKKRKFNSNSIYKNIDVIIIDEVSMLRADLLDCVEKFLRLNGKVPNLPFGGTQIIFIGDLLQLPPVVMKDEQFLFQSYYDSPYFFSAKCMKECYCHVIEFTKVYRQVDTNFIDMLNSIRNNRATQNTISVLNERVNKKFQKAKLSVLLTTTNKKAQDYNEKFLNQINEEEKVFTAEVEDIENMNNFPANYELKIKVGAQVMMLNNDSSNRWVNGSIGVVQSIEKSLDLDEDIIYVRFQNGMVEPVERHTWDLFKYQWNEELQKIETQKAGSFSQYPIKLAWAVTIHKSQGKTFDNVLIDLGYGAFAPGQLYVALSRCKSIEGISLVRPIKPRDIIIDNRIEKLLSQRTKINYLTDPNYKLM
jgi:ATP-dependent exoDNAse (exonuclease V) alpha subunit